METVEIRTLKIYALLFVVIMTLTLTSCGSEPITGNLSSEIESIELSEEELLAQEIETIIADAESNLDEKLSNVKSALRSAKSGSANKKCTASDKMIADVSFEVLQKEFNGNKKLIDYINYSAASRDSYGRTICSFSYEVTDLFGIKSEIRNATVCLQSCSNSGEYTYLAGKAVSYSIDIHIIDYALKPNNNWDKDPNEDSRYESDYQTALKHIENGNYGEAAEILQRTDDYKSSKKLVKAINEYTYAKTYSDGVKIFKNGKYSDAISALEELRPLRYRKTSRIIEICEQKLKEKGIENGNSSGESTVDDSVDDGEYADDDYDCVGDMDDDWDGDWDERDGDVDDAWDGDDYIDDDDGRDDVGDDWDDDQDDIPSDSSDSLNSAHQHSFVNHPGKPATCTESGWYDYKTCSCGYTDYCEIPALGHEYAFVEYKEETCETNGYYRYECVNCEDSYYKTIYATGHVLAPATCLAPSTCKKCGKLFGEIGEHEYQIEGYSEKKGIQCINCGEFENSWTSLNSEINYAYYPNYPNRADSMEFEMDRQGHCILTVFYQGMTDVIEFYIKNETFTTRLNEYVYDCYDKSGKKIDGMEFSYRPDPYETRCCDYGIVKKDEDGYGFEINILVYKA